MAVQTKKVGDVVGRNARGGIDKVSRREMAGEVPQGSTGMYGTANFRTLGTIPASATPQTPVQVPTMPEPATVPGGLAVNNASLAPSLGMSVDDSGNLVPSPVQTPTDTSFQSLFEQAAGSKLSAFQEMGSAEERQAKLREEVGLAQKEALYNNLSGRINAINRKSQADVLKQENALEKAGATKAVFSAKASRIERDAAIRALPLQAELAVASGDLNSARQYVSDMAQVQSQDAQNLYNFKSSLIDSVYQFASDEQQRKLDAIKDKEDKAYDMQKTNLGLQNEWAQTAISYGQGSIAGKLMALDPNAPDFQSKFAQLTGQVQKPVEVKPYDSGWEIKDVNGESMWVNTQTMETKPISGVPGGVRELSYEDNAKFNSTPEAKAIKDATSYAEAVKNYKSAIETYGTGEMFGKGKGVLNEAYSSLVGATKDYYTLGTYDNGVQKLIALGIPEPSLTGLKVNRIGALDSALGTAKDKIQRNVAQLSSTKFGNSVEFQTLVKNATGVVGDATPQTVDWGLFDESDIQELQSFGINPTSQSTSSGFNPASFY